MSKISFWFTLAVIYPLSLLPFPIIYILSDITYIVLYRVIGYRKKVVIQNIAKSFPKKNKNEIATITDQYYRNLSDLIWESIKLLSMSEESVIKRCRFENPEEVFQLKDEGKSMIMSIGHCGNWELAGLSTSLKMRHKTSVFYRPLKNKHFNKFFIQNRKRFGMQLIASNNTRLMLKELNKEPRMYIFITDQTPSNANTSHWTYFLNQETPVFKGTEKIAKMTNLPVFFGDIKRVDRGYYSIKMHKIIDDPSQTKPGEITEAHTRILEKSINRQPDNWLWSHKRWKIKKPDDIIIAHQSVRQN